MSGTHSARHPVPTGNLHRQKRRGTILVLAAAMMIVMMGMLAMSIDVGYMMNVQTEMKRATDAAALAGAGSLVDGTDVAQLQALDFMLRNPVGSQALLEQENREALLQAWLAEHPDEFEVAVGHWDPDTRTFSQSEQEPSTIHVIASRNDVPLFFARIFGRDSFDVRAESMARYQPRDIALVLDFSASMNDDSELRRIDEYGEDARQAVEDSLWQIYNELNPSYGNLQFEPEYVTIVGNPPSYPSFRQVEVTFRSSDVYVSSTKTLSQVRIYFSEGGYQTFNSPGGTSGAFCGTGYYSGRTIYKVRVKSGSYDSGEYFEDDYDDVKQALGLDGVSYPYPSGSWDNYIYYVKTSYYLRKAGYKKMYGYKTLINYWLEQKPTHSQTPDLWRASAQPVTAVKDAVGVFMNYIQEVDCEDRVGLVVYNDYYQNAILEQTLTEDFATIEDIVEHRQAGHYDQYTNIGAGIHDAWVELDAHARTGAQKMIVLMTDGQANRPSYNAYGYALEQAQIAASKHYPIVTISLGNAADTGLMQQIADISDGVHFNVPGGESVTDYEDDLLAVFRQIADDRPLILVK